MLTDASGARSLATGVDADKDQSYFLYRLTDAQMKHVLFPLGALHKTEVRAFAERLGLPVARKPESQDICFAVDGDYASVVAQRVPEAVRDGDIVDGEGRVVGRHQGVAHYTIGQRKGLGIGGSEEPLFVVRLDAAANRVVVGRASRPVSDTCGGVRRRLARRADRAADGGRSLPDDARAGGSDVQGRPSLRSARPTDRRCRARPVARLLPWRCRRRRGDHRVRELIDCHIHTERCGHASGTAAQMVSAAVFGGLAGIVMTEHLALPDDLDPDRRLSMCSTDLATYAAEVTALAERVHGLTVVLGAEADWLPDRPDHVRTAVADARAHGVRVLLGSVHFIEEWAFDDPNDVAEWDKRDVDEVYRQYFELWCDAARSGHFDVMAHPDLPKKFGHRPTFDATELYGEAAQRRGRGRRRDRGLHGGPPQAGWRALPGRRSAQGVL